MIYMISSGQVTIKPSPGIDEYYAPFHIYIHANNRQVRSSVGLSVCPFSSTTELL